MTQFGEVKNGIGAYALKNGDTRYRVVYRKDGKLKSKGGFVRQGDARRFQTLNSHAVLTDSWIDPTRARKAFGDFAGDWLGTADVRPNTQALYDYLLRCHLNPTFGAVPLSNITPESVRHWLHALRKTELSASTIAKCYRLLRRILNVAVSERYLNANPANIKGAGTEPTPVIHAPTPEQVGILADAVNARYRALVLLAGWGGLRWGELAALQRQHVDLEEGCVHVRSQTTETGGHLRTNALLKTSAGRRTVYLPTFVLEALELHLQNAVRMANDESDALVFTAARGGPLRRSRFRRDEWLPATKQAGCPEVTFHSLRHCAATQAAITGATTKELMERMGHASAVAALRYQHSTVDRQRAIARGLDALT